MDPVGGLGKHPISKLAVNSNMEDHGVFTETLPVSYGFKSSKRGDMRDRLFFIGVMKGDTKGLDYSSHGCSYIYNLQHC